MKNLVLVTGISGSGKTSLSHKLREMGYVAHDTDSVRRLFSMVDRNTMKPIVNFDHNDLQKVKAMRWICDINRLRQMFAEEESRDFAFYCGAASNLEEIYPLFSMVVLLRASPVEIRRRLSSRTTNAFGNRREIQDHILSFKDWWEGQVTKWGAEVVNADSELDVVALEVIAVCSKILSIKPLR